MPRTPTTPDHPRPQTEQEGDAHATPRYGHPMSGDTAVEAQLTAREEGGVLWLTLDRPEAGNALTPAQRDRLVGLLQEASARVATRVVVLTATGRHFCTGADLRASQGTPTHPDGVPERVVGDIGRVIATGAQRLVSAVLDCEKPVIAAVNGTAAGIGAHLALACDLVLAAEGARFIEVFVRRGIVPDGGGAYLLPRLVGLHRAKELVLFGDDCPAEEAERIGLVNRVVPADELEAVAGAWAGRLAEGPTPALTLAKALLNRSLDVDRTTAFAEEAAAQEIAMTSEDAAEGVRSFVERRPPQFRG